MSKILYKYRAIRDADRKGDDARSFARNLITKGELYFPRFSELNDPNESIFDYSEDVDIAVNDNEIINYPQHIYVEKLSDGRNHITVDGRAGAIHVRSRIDSIYGILCLTETNNSPLMFDYYAAGHKGICIGFDWKKFGIVYRGTKNLQIPKKIIYRCKPPLINASNASNFDDVFFTKWREYKHEKEYRLTFGNRIFDNRERVLSSIKEIIFGCATSGSDKDLVRGWVAEAGISVEFFEAHLKPRSYNLKIKKI